MKQTVFAVPMKCDACVKHVSDALYGLGGISKVEGNLEDQLVLVEGTGKGYQGFGGARRPGWQCDP